MEKNESYWTIFNERYQQEARKIKVYITKILRGYGKSRPVEKEEYEVKKIIYPLDFLFQFHDDSVTWLCFFGYNGDGKIISFYPLSEK